MLFYIALWIFVVCFSIMAVLFLLYFSDMDDLFFIMAILLFYFVLWLFYFICLFNYLLNLFIIAYLLIQK